MATSTFTEIVIGTSSFKEVGMGATNLAIYKRDMDGYVQF